MKIKNTIILILMLSVYMSACTPSQQVTNSWVNREALPKGPYKSIFILTLTEDLNAKIAIENQLLRLINSRGQKAVKSSDVFTPVFNPANGVSREELAKFIKDKGCDAVFTVTLIDVKSDTTYHSGTTYYPMSRGFYGSYYGYYGYYSTKVYEPGYYTTDKSFFLESNFYDLASDQLLWSFQSEAYNPASLKKWFQGYSRMLISQLKKEGLIQK